MIKTCREIPQQDCPVQTVQSCRCLTCSRFVNIPKDKACPWCPEYGCPKDDEEEKFQDASDDSAQTE